jgi:hypothetical protein
LRHREGQKTKSLRAKYGSHLTVIVDDASFHHSLTLTF